jgi:hypothetical protein
MDTPNVTACDNNQCATWHVETRSGYTSVDQAVSAATGPLDGYDSFKNFYWDLNGIDDRDIAHAASDYRVFHF